MSESDVLATRIRILEASVRALNTQAHVSAQATHMALILYDLEHGRPDPNKVDLDRMLLVAKFHRACTTALLVDLS